MSHSCHLICAGNEGRGKANVTYLQFLTVVFTNFMWTFEYFPGRNLDNVAILTETVWEEGST